MSGLALAKRGRIEDLWVCGGAPVEGLALFRAESVATASDVPIRCTAVLAMAANMASTGPRAHRKCADGCQRARHDVSYVSRSYPGHGTAGKGQERALK